MADKTYENILIEREGGITFVWLNRPDKRNAMSPGLHADMDDALSWLATSVQASVNSPRMSRSFVARMELPSIS